MTERIRISEVKEHRFKGGFPEVPTYPHVDTDLLYKGDDDPFHINLAVAELGVSANGLVYDDPLLDTLAEQLQQGIGGIRGHIPEGAEGTAFPIEEVFWIGTVKEQGKIWCKGYVPPGDTREFIRIKMAQNGRIRTSIYGSAVRETADGQSGQWHAKDFELEQLDLAPAKRASLKVGDGKFTITREMATEDAMPEITINDVPQSVREQIIAQAQGNVNAERVKELEQQLQTQHTAHAERVKELEQQAQASEQTIAELKKNASVVAEIYTVLGEDADVVSIVRQMHTAMTALAEQLGVKFADVSVRVTEMHEQIAEMQQSAFDHMVNRHIAELTNWTARDEAGKKKVDAFRRTVKRAVLTELDDKRDEQAVKETVEKLWDEEFEPLSAAVIGELAGPPAVVPQTRQKPTGANGLNLEEGWETRILEEFGVGSNRR